MLGSSDVIAFVATGEADAARAFYEGILSLRLVSDEPFALVFDANDTMLRIAKVQGFTPARHTVLGWRVADIRAAAAALAARGVVFERYDGMAQDDLGIWNSPGAKVAWFKDPAGNTLSLTQLEP